jgi:SAM-dependent methyltransferase
MKECSTLIRWLAGKPAERILDIGCGDGYYDTLIARTGAYVVGIDIHRKRLSQAQRLRCGSSTEFHYMDAQELDFAGASFDKAVSFCVIEHLHDSGQVIRNIARVLKPGGWLVFSADSLSTPGITAQERERHKERYAVNTFYTRQNLQEKLTGAGFEMEETQYIINTPFDLALVRLSWKLDDLPVQLRPLRSLGYLVLAAIWKASSLLSRPGASDVDGGLTLLVRARKIPAPGAPHAGAS